MKQFIYLAILIGAAGCAGNNNTSAIDTLKPIIEIDSSAKEAAQGPTEELKNASLDIDSALHTRLKWVDPLVARYNRLTVTDSAERWLWDRLETSETGSYIVIQRGHNMEEEGGPLFSVDNWLYIDTLTRAVYEYDVANDSLILWKK